MKLWLEEFEFEFRKKLIKFITNEERINSQILLRVLSELFSINSTNILQIIFVENNEYDLICLLCKFCLFIFFAIYFICNIFYDLLCSYYDIKLNKLKEKIILFSLINSSIIINYFILEYFIHFERHI